ncbi:hypothetical protein RO3G_10262 [Rhizopus delemar RA 99-880]|uniref:Uncharacterized protein n=1 Tax=Rhizopus delemar (strain RA 99-880 / ATCC MYA-4621 / FGSC 9543 / NRRL 43880) TaxID=246409 RepID=I1CAS2_RHIO9|nr:hypothetical protein RO3G_10262 [Rhizopus delemar RA 99-880]|eukprot:EIE85552.1 hypothetical protein RO3G_10262 [Rhizopus delemar RA 99-880]
MYEMINNLFDELKQFQFDSDTNKEITQYRENVCEATKRMQIINEGDVIYGKILELIVTSEQDVRGIELCSLEFRKGNASYTTLLYQQSKNLRINACILNEFHLWTLEGNISIAYLDFSGRNESISQIFKMNDQYVAHEVGLMMFTIYDFFATVIRFIWKAHWQQFFEQTPVVDEIVLNQIQKELLKLSAYNSLC